MLAISIDSPEQSASLVKDLALPLAIVSDPRMDVIRAYGMRGDGMDMADMGYVMDKQGRIRTLRIDRRFGENGGAIARAVREAKTPP